MDSESELPLDTSESTVYGPPLHVSARIQAKSSLISYPYNFPNSPTDAKLANKSYPADEAKLDALQEELEEKQNALEAMRAGQAGLTSTCGDGSSLWRSTPPN